MASPKIGIIGAGFSGLCAAIQLRKQLNIDTFTLFDENEDVGGTWLYSRYPGCGSDVPSHLYSFSFEPNPYWSVAYPGQEEIWEYLQNVAKKYDLYHKINFHHKVITAIWDETMNKWKLTILNTQSGQESQHIFDIVIGGIGALRVPNYPEQFEPFSGEKMHSGHWNSSIELDNKVVAVVGTGASAVQLIPEIVDKVKKLIVYQRNPAWVMPKLQCTFPSYVQWAFAHIPGVQWTLRNLIFWSSELNHSTFKVDTFMSRLAVKLGSYYLNRQVEDPELRKKLTPSYSFGCKRVTPSCDYYPALARKNVKVINSIIVDVTKDTIVNEDGTREKPDVLILTTGYKVQDFFAPLNIKVKGGEDLLTSWKEFGPRAYAGIACHLAPNAFFLLGPNTGLGHNSVVFSIECQVNWTIKVIKEMIKRNARTVAVKKSVEDEYMNNLLTSLNSTVWGATECGSWYADHRGIITTLWPGTLVSYYNLTKSVNPSHFDFS